MILYESDNEIEAERVFTKSASFYSYDQRVLFSSHHNISLIFTSSSNHFNKSFIIKYKVFIIFLRSSSSIDL